MDHAPAIAELPICNNCQTELAGEYCQNCGQKALHHDSWALSHFLHELWHETVHLDSKIFKTLKLLLFQPGDLTRLYLSGQRQPFVNPIRLYLAITALFFGSAQESDTCTNWQWFRGRACCSLKEF